MTEPQTSADCTVIVVDDDQALRESLKFSLEIDGFNVRIYADSKGLLAESSFPNRCCLVVDQNMPGMTGLDLITALRKRNVYAPAILITSHPNSSVVERAAREGVYIAEKPLLGGGLVARIRHDLALDEEGTENAFSGRQDSKTSEKGKPMIKDVLVNLAIGSDKDVAADYALSIGRVLDLHFSGVAFAYEPVIAGSVLDGITPSIIDKARTDNRRAAEAAATRFEEAARKAGASVESRIVQAGTVEAGEVFARLARSYDLSVVPQPKPDDGLLQDEIIEAALFSSGRPVLVVPYIQKAGFKADRVLVCWDGSRNAARAIADSIPLLQKAHAVDVVNIRTKDDRSELRGIEIAQHLARHGLKTELRPIVTTETDVASVILSHAADTSADLIVMGGYGHSRLREFFLGGATRGILQAMTVPTLMSH